MEEETIVINDLLSFMWCKAKTTPRHVLLKCAESFYSEQFASDALHSLITAVPVDVKKALSPNPYEAIIELMEYIPANQLPTFVCRNLNNVPDIDSVNKAMDNLDDVYLEHKRLMSEVDVLNKSLSTLSEQLNSISDDAWQKDVTNNEADAVGNRLKIKKNKEKETKLRTIIKMDVEDEEEENLEAVEEEAFEVDEELKMGLIANRYQRALARKAEKGNQESKTKKFKTISFDSVPKNLNLKAESVLSPNDTIFPSSCKINPLTSTVSKRRKTTLPFATDTSKSHIEMDSDASFGTTHARPLSDIPTPDFKVLNVSKTSSNTEWKTNSKKVDPKIQYSCPLCSNGFFEEEWTNHVRDCHGDDETKNPDEIRCHICNCFYADRKMLAYHMGYHDTARQYGCNECGYRFYTDKALEGHLRLHSPLCKNKCPFCNFKTYKTFRVKEHVRSHTGERPYKCKLCSYATTTYDILRGHLKSHSCFKCSKCDQSFSSKNKLLAHEQLHNSDNAQTCNGCKNVSCTSSHCKQVATENLFSCTECSFKFEDKNVLRIHVKEMHT